jgi:hypothetical protein
MGRFISLISAVTIAAGGTYLLAIQTLGGRWHGILLLTAASMLGLGIGWLWVDFVRPMRDEG